VGAHLDGGQTAVVHVLAVVGAVGDGTLDGSVGGAGAPVVGTSSVHGVPPVKRKVRPKGLTVVLPAIRFYMPSSAEAKLK